MLCSRGERVWSVDIEFRSLVDEIPVQLLPATLVPGELLRPRLHLLGQP